MSEEERAARRAYDRERYHLNLAQCREKAKRRYLRLREKRLEEHRNPTIDVYIRRLMSDAKRRAAEKGREYSLDFVWLAQQPNVCAVTGADFRLTPGVRDPRSPSIDRIDSTVGYTPANSRLVCNWYNLAKSNFDEQEMHALILAAAKNISSKPLA